MREGKEPFLKGEVIEHEGFFTEISEIQNNPNYIAKIIGLNYQRGKDEGEGKLTYEQRLEKFKKDIKIEKEYLGEIIPEFHVAIGAPENWETENNAGAPIVFMKRVIPQKNIEDADITTIANAKYQIVHAVTEIYLNNFDGEKGYSIDIEKEINFIYGKTDTDEKSKLYFVDLYPIPMKTPQKYLLNLREFIKNDGNITINEATYSTIDIPISHDDKIKADEAFQKLEELIIEKDNNVHKKP